MVGAKEELCALALLFPVLAIVSLAQSHGNTTDFSFASFGNNNSNQLIYMGSASFNSSEGCIDLTPSPNTTSGASSNETVNGDSDMYNSTGRVLYREPITVWPATFTTTFTLLVQNITVPSGQKSFNGDGLAFIIVPNNKSFLPDSYGGYLGLFDSSIDENAMNQVAIEFDTFKNEWDPNDNHIGVDIKSIKSNATSDLGQNGIDIKSGRPIRVRVHYDGWNKTLQIYAAYADGPNPCTIILNRTIELSSTVRRSSYLGFSASTGNSFEIHRILDWNFSSEILPESSVSVTRSGGESKSRRLEVGLLAGSIIVGAVLLGLSAWFVAEIRKRRRGARRILSRRFSRELLMMEDRSSSSSYAPRRFSYKRLLTATKGFSERELLGTGGFGSVYRGTLEDPDGTTALVAVKRISARSRQGEREYISEISTIGRLRHRNLVQLHGWCHERDELLLVYDYMPNGSLDKVIFRQPLDQHQIQNQAHLNWARRHRILCGLASAMLYLHEEWEQRIVHRDIKPSNVMLDGEFNARLGDFGLARLIEHEETNPGVTTMLAGTPGYVAPECGYICNATAESDVFSFGVVVLEVASGRRVTERKPPFSERNLVDWIWNLYGQGKVIEAADPRLDGDFEGKQMTRALILGLACSHPDPQLRPSIRQALQVLINPSEPMVPLPSSRPLAIYVVLPPNAGPNSLPAASSSNVGYPGLASTSSAYSEAASITTSILHYGR